MDTISYTPRAVTIRRSETDPDRYHVTYEASESCGITESHDLARWHDVVMAIEFQRPSWRNHARSVHPAIVEILEDVRNAEATGIAAVTICAEARQVPGPCTIRPALPRDAD